MLTVGKIRPSL